MKQLRLKTINIALYLKVVKLLYCRDTDYWFQLSLVFMRKNKLVFKLLWKFQVWLNVTVQVVMCFRELVQPNEKLNDTPSSSLVFQKNVCQLNEDTTWTPGTREIGVDLLASLHSVPCTWWQPVWTSPVVLSTASVRMSACHLSTMVITIIIVNAVTNHSSQLILNNPLSCSIQFRHTSVGWIAIIQPGMHDTAS